MTATPPTSTPSFWQRAGERLSSVNPDVWLVAVVAVLGVEFAGLHLSPSDNGEMAAQRPALIMTAGPTAPQTPARHIECPETPPGQ